MLQGFIVVYPQTYKLVFFHRKNSLPFRNQCSVLCLGFSIFTISLYLFFGSNFYILECNSVGLARHVEPCGIGYASLRNFSLFSLGKKLRPTPALNRAPSNFIDARRIPQKRMSNPLRREMLCKSYYQI